MKESSKALADVRGVPLIPVEALNGRRLSQTDNDLVRNALLETNTTEHTKAHRTADPVSNASEVLSVAHLEAAVSRRVAKAASVAPSALCRGDRGSSGGHRRRPRGSSRGPGDVLCCALSTLLPPRPESTSPSGPRGTTRSATQRQDPLRRRTRQHSRAPSILPRRPRTRPRDWREVDRRGAGVEREQPRHPRGLTLVAGRGPTSAPGGRDHRRGPLAEPRVAHWRAGSERPQSQLALLPCVLGAHHRPSHSHRRPDPTAGSGSTRPRTKRQDPRRAALFRIGADRRPTTKKTADTASIAGPAGSAG